MKNNHQSDEDFLKDVYEQQYRKTYIEERTIFLQDKARREAKEAARHDGWFKRLLRRV